MARRLGIIAEDESDVGVVTEIARKIATRNFSVRRFVGHGCGKIRGKCRAWTIALRGKGCDALILLHDLDQAAQAELHRDLEAALQPSAIAHYVIVIPVRELEAWLLADPEAIQRAVNAKKAVKPVANPQAILRPKEYLRDLVERITGRPIYINTVHNLRIAERVRIANLRRCSSFIPLEQFIRQHFT